ncbi:MAG: phosphate signaling complex protein PhoU [Anaerolineae bacterium]|nr:phosphate signaling complex protein PhoU [Anaerolineae bacterium]
MHARETYERELARLREDLLAMGSEVQRAISRSIIALDDRDVELARSIIAEDEVINDHRFRIETACHGIMATQQPTARDLRVLIAALMIAVDLERMADHAKGIAKTVTLTAREPSFPPAPDLHRMSDSVRRMLDQGLQAFAETDVELAQRVCASDDEIDHLYKQFFNVMLSYMLEDPRSITRATYLLWIAHNLERIADLATNVSERVIYYATGHMQDTNF